MIKLNLLPTYVNEVRRIGIVIIIFLIFVVLELLVIFKAYIDLQAQEAWFTHDKDYYTNRAADIAKEKSAADDLKGKVNSWDSYTTFFSRKDTVDHAEAIAKSLAEVGQVLGSSGRSEVWYDNYTLKDTAVTAEGHINGLMNFVDFYFNSKDSGLTVEPGAKPTPSPSPADVKMTAEQPIKLKITASIKTAVPKAPQPPETAITVKEFCVPGTKAAAPAAAPAAAAPPAGAPPAGAPPAAAPPPAPHAAGGGGGGGGKSDDSGGGGGISARKNMDAN